MESPSWCEMVEVAVEIIASTFRNARYSDCGSFISPVTVSTPSSCKPLTFSSCEDVRTSPFTFLPAAASLRQTSIPRTPVAPTTSTVEFFVLLRAICLFCVLTMPSRLLLLCEFCFFLKLEQKINAPFTRHLLRHFMERSDRRVGRLIFKGVPTPRQMLSPCG